MMIIIIIIMSLMPWTHQMVTAFSLCFIGPWIWLRSLVSVRVGAATLYEATQLFSWGFPFSMTDWGGSYSSLLMWVYLPCSLSLSISLWRTVWYFFFMDSGSGEGIKGHGEYHDENRTHNFLVVRLRAVSLHQLLFLSLVLFVICYDLLYLINEW